jgi:hypothetical protein
MPIDPKSLTRDLIQGQRAGYEQMERDRLREEWKEPTDEEKIAFDEFMDDVLRVPKPYFEHECGLVEWYRQLMRRDR